MVFDHIAQTTGAFIETATLADTEVFSHRHLYAGHIVAVPDRFEKGIGKAKIQDVHDCFFAQIVVDPKDRRLGKHGAGDRVQFARRSKIAAERFFDDDPRVLGQASHTQAMDHGLEQCRRDRKIIGGTFGQHQRTL